MFHEPEFEPSGPTIPGSAQITWRLQRIIASAHSGTPKGETAERTVALPRKPSPEELQAQARQQLDALLSGPAQDRYVFDCAEHWFLAVDGEERVALLLLFWNKVGRPKQRIILRHVSEALRESLHTKGLLNGIFQVE